jgi:hypothetical protein
MHVYLCIVHYFFHNYLDLWLRIDNLEVPPILWLHDLNSRRHTREKLVSNHPNDLVENL